MSAAGVRAEFLRQLDDCRARATQASVAEARATLLAFAARVDELDDAAVAANLRGWIEKMRQLGVQPVAFQRDAWVDAEIVAPLRALVDEWTVRLQKSVSIAWRISDRENVAESAGHRGAACRAVAPGMTRALAHWISLAEEDDHDWLCAKTATALAAMGALEAAPVLVALVSARGRYTGLHNAHLAALDGLEALGAHQHADDLTRLLPGVDEPELLAALAGLLATWQHRSAVAELTACRAAAAKQADAQETLDALDEAIQALTKPA